MLPLPTLAASRERRATAGAQRRDDDFEYSDDDSLETELVDEFATTGLSIVGPTPDVNEDDAGGGEEAEEAGVRRQ